MSGALLGKCVEGERLTRNLFGEPFEWCGLNSLVVSGANVPAINVPLRACAAIDSQVVVALFVVIIGAPGNLQLTYNPVGLNPAVEGSLQH